MGTIVDTFKMLKQDNMDCSDSSSSDCDEDDIQDLVIKSLSNIKEKLQIHNSQSSETSPIEEEPVCSDKPADQSSCFIIDKVPSNQQTFQAVTETAKNTSLSVTGKKKKKKRKSNPTEKNNLFVIDKSPSNNTDSP